ncbi:MAG: DUF1439 domain-containing protein [Thiohalomonadales bacterium]
MTNKQLQYGFIAAGILLLLILVFSTIGSNSILSNTESVQLSSKQVQRSINRSFPLAYSNNSVKIKLKNPTVILKEGWDYVAINLDLNLAVKKRRANRRVFQTVHKGKVTLSGSLAYSPKSGSILLKEVKLRILNFKNIKATDIAQIEKSLVPILQNKLDSHPIYRLKSKQFKYELNNMKLSNIEIKENNINLELALNATDQI